MLREEVRARSLALAGASLRAPRGAEHAVLADSRLPRAAEPLGREAGEELRGGGDQGVDVERLGEFAEDGVQHVGVVGVEELGAAVEDDLREHVDGEGRLAREEDVEEARDFVLGLDVVGVHGEGAGEGEEWLVLGEVGPEGGVGGVEDDGDEAELGDGGREVGEVKVSYAEEGEACDGWGAKAGWEDEQEDLGYVVVALEVVDIWMATEDGEDQIGEGGFG